MSILRVRHVVAASSSILGRRALGAAVAAATDAKDAGPSTPPPPPRIHKSKKKKAKAPAQAPANGSEQYAQMTTTLLGALDKIAGIKNSTQEKRALLKGALESVPESTVESTAESTAVSVAPTVKPKKKKLKAKAKAVVAGTPQPTAAVAAGTPKPMMTIKGQKVLKADGKSPYRRSLKPSSPGKLPAGVRPVLSKAEVAKQRAAFLENQLVRLGPLVNAADGYVLHTREPTLKDITPIAEQRPVAKLAHGLDRVLFNPGIHWLQDPRSGVYNFTPTVQSIPKVTDFAFEKLPGFTSSSRDQELWELAQREDRTYAGSTSSLSGMLSHIYFLISAHKPVNVTQFIAGFSSEPRNFTPGQRMPTTVVFNHKDGRYAIDSSSDLKAEKNVLTWMGTLLEKYLTSDKEEFATFMRNGGPVGTAEPEDRELRDAFRFSKSQKFVMRSQLDCQDHRLPGTGVFDIKTRASLSIRMDLLNFENNSGYLIDKLHGPSNSFEKEFYDLVRSAFLKYSFQVRIGNMDGVFVAYHNTERMFGFQYVSLEEMDNYLYGKGHENVGERVFNKCVGLMEAIADRAVGLFPGESVKCTFETPEPGAILHVWVEPAEWHGEGPKPLKELVVTVRHYLGDTEGPTGRHCMYSNAPWSIAYNIAERDHTVEEKVRKDLDGAMQRKFRPLSLPDGVTLDAIMDWWNNLNFGGTQNPEAMITDPEFFTAYFAEPDAMVTALRQLAQQGRLTTKKREQEEQGLPVFVVGEEFDEQAALDKKKHLEKLQLEREQASAKRTEALEKAVRWDAFGNGAEAETATADSDTAVPVPHIKIGYDVEVEKSPSARADLLTMDDEPDSTALRDKFQEPEVKTDLELQEDPAETGTVEASSDEDPTVESEVQPKVNDEVPPKDSSSST